MAVKIKVGKAAAYPLTSPPSQPAPYPSSELIAKTIAYADRTIIVTVPFPDTLELIASITNEIMLQPDMSKKSATAIAKEIDLGIGAFLMTVAMGAPEELTAGVNANHTKATWRLPYDPVEPLNKAHLTLRRHQKADTSFGSWTVKLEFSASKAGPDGLLKLTASLDEAVGDMFSIDALIGAFRIARVDAAVDCIGASPLDMIAHVPKPGKRLVYVGDHGRPESVYLYEAKPVPKEPPKKVGYRTVGPHRLTLYERRDYFIQRKLPPPYGNCPVTRAEVVYKPSQRPSLADLAAIPNQFSKRRIAYAAGVACKREWKKFCMAAFGAGAVSAAWSWMPGRGQALEKLYRSCAGDLISENCWERWADGIIVTGLSAWIKKAAVSQDKL